MKKITIWLFTLLIAALNADPVQDTKKITGGKIGLDIKIGWNQASTGCIVHLNSWLAINPYALYRNEEKSSDGLPSSTSTSYKTKESYYGGGAFIPLYIAHVENLYVKLMPGFAYAKGTLSEQYVYGSSYGLPNANKESATTRISWQFFIGLQYAITQHLHVIAETGINYSEYKYSDPSYGNYASKLTNLYSGDIGLIFYFN